MITQNNELIYKIPADTDIYLIDQIMKGKYNENEIILDAGCGEGRNMKWFLQNNYKIFGTDINEGAIHNIKSWYPQLLENRFIISAIEETIFNNGYFDHILCVAVLHFAKNTIHFKKMLAALVRILKPGGTLFIRMASDIGIEKKVECISDGVYNIPDGTQRFLLTKKILADCLLQLNLKLAEPLKTVNVNDERCMSTLLLQKIK